MKSMLYFSLSLLMGLSSHLNAQIQFELGWSDAQILAACFEASWDEEHQSLVRKPSLYERWRLREDSELFYLQLDTAFEYSISKDNKTNIYRTILCSSRPEYANDCRACYPHLSIIVLQRASNSSAWTLYNFNQYANIGGAWGEKPAFSVLQLGQAKALCFELTQSSLGYTSTSLSIYVLGYEVLSRLMSQHNGGASMEEDESDFWGFSTAFRVDDKTEPIIISLHCRGTKWSGETKQIVPVDLEEHYKFEHDSYNYEGILRRL